MISVDKAYSEILSMVPEPQTEFLPLLSSAGRILYQDVFAERDAPPFDRVMMDGYAIAHSSQSHDRYTIEGIALAGHESPVLKDTTHCLEVTTGCALPAGCDTIIPVEDCIINDNVMSLREGVELSPKQYIHKQGSDVRSRSLVLGKGLPIRAPEMAVLATENVTDVRVSRLPRIGLVTTGDEVIHDAKALLPGQIRGSHFPSLFGLFSQFAGIPFTHCHARDDESDLLEKLKNALEHSDVILVTGGVSRGRKDLVPGLLKQLGVEEILHRVAQRPGKPLWFGRKEDKLVFGLPGNPISSLVCSRRYVFPVIEKWMGMEPTEPPSIQLANRVEPLEGMTWFVPVRLKNDRNLVDPFATSGSLHDLSGTDGFIELPPAGSDATKYNFYSWNSR